MRSRTNVLIPFALSLIVTGCGTTSSDSSQGQLIYSTSQHDDGASLTEQSIKAQDQKIQSLQDQLADNQSNLKVLQQRLDQKDKLIASLQAPLSNAQSLVALEKEKRLREQLESQYRELKLKNNQLETTLKILEIDNAHLQKRLNASQLDPSKSDDNPNYVALNQTYQTLRSAHYALKNKYKALQGQKNTLQKKYNALVLDNLVNQKALDSLKKENLKLSEQISDSRAQQDALLDKVHVQNNMIKDMESSLTTHYLDSTNADSTREKAPLASAKLQSELTMLKAQLAAQTSLIADYQKSARKLKREIAQHTVSNKQIVALKANLARLDRMNTAANNSLLTSRQALSASQAKAQSLSDGLSRLEQEKNSVQQQLVSLQEKVDKSETERTKLESQVNDLIPFQAEVASFKNQLGVSLQSVTWQLPKEASLHNNFEIIVTAQVHSPVAGQSYVAQLVTDSAIKMISSPKVEASLQNGQLQWRWRLSGLNERPHAKLNLFVSQEMNYQNKTILRQVYNGSETMALNNDNLLDKYGFWAGAILLGLAGGFGIGYVSRKKKET